MRTLGVDAVNPVNGETIPIFISDYVLASYGTGAIMAVPGHDQRDWEFAKEFGPANNRGRQGRRRDQGGVISPRTTAPSW